MDINTHLNSGNATKADAEYAAEKFDEMTGILGILYNRKAAAPEEVMALAEERAQARKNKDWAKADELRAKITELGYAVEDTQSGPKLIKL